MKAGALNLASPEVKIHMDSAESSDPIDVKQREQVETNSLVEEFMLLANISVATKIHETFPLTAVLRQVASTFFGGVFWPVHRPRMEFRCIHKRLPFSPLPPQRPLTGGGRRDRAAYQTITPFYTGRACRSGFVSRKSIQYSVALIAESQAAYASSKQQFRDPAEYINEAQGCEARRLQLRCSRCIFGQVYCTYFLVCPLGASYFISIEPIISTARIHSSRSQKKK
jgi:hypothetical protein